jgi:hypothetical protein
MVFCVQLAADSASAAAPRTVLQAPSAMQVPIINTAINFDFMSTLPFVPEMTMPSSWLLVDFPAAERAGLALKGLAR